MSCCKTNDFSIEKTLNQNSGEKKEVNYSELTLKYFLKSVGFLLFLTVLPILNLYIIWMCFNMFVLNKNIDFKPILIFLGDKFRDKDKEETDLEDFNEEDYILDDLEEVIDGEYKVFVNNN